MIQEYGIFTIYFMVISFIIGTVMGSFINCLAWRTVSGESVLKGRSHCPQCSHLLKWVDLVPIFSFVSLKGQCRYCGKEIPVRYILTELFTGIIFLAIVLKSGPTWETLKEMVLVCILVTLSLVDFDTFEIPDGFILAGVVNWVITVPLVSGYIGPKWMVYNHIQWPISFMKHYVKSGLLAGFILALGMLAMSVVFDKLTGKESLGGGDIKLFFVIGLYTGIVQGVFCLLLSCVIGIIFSAVVKKNRIPFGPSISLAMCITLLVGSRVANWYIHLIM